MYTIRMGRPTKEFDPANEEELYALSKKGASFAKLCLALGVTKPTFIRWRKENPAFNEILEKCKLLAQVHYEELADKIIRGEQEAVSEETQKTTRSAGYGAPSLLRFIMSTRFYSDYSGLGGNSWDPLPGGV